jgi:hypothetical protein
MAGGSGESTALPPYTVQFMASTFGYYMYLYYPISHIAPVGGPVFFSSRLHEIRDKQRDKTSGRNGSEAERFESSFATAVHGDDLCGFGERES